MSQTLEEKIDEKVAFSSISHVDNIRKSEKKRHTERRKKRSNFNAYQIKRIAYIIYVSSIVQILECSQQPDRQKDIEREKKAMEELTTY